MKVYYQGRLVNGRFSSLRARIRSLIRFTFKWTLVVGAGVLAGAMFFSSSSTIYATQEVIKEVPVKGYADVMNRIAECESGGQQFGKHGQVIININKNGTYDQGKYQINSIHNETATKLGYNLATEEGNEGFAYWMYENLGTRDWYSSEKCWRK